MRLTTRMAIILKICGKAAAALSSFFSDFYRTSKSNTNSRGTCLRPQGTNIRQNVSLSVEKFEKTKRPVCTHFAESSSCLRLKFFGFFLASFSFATKQGIYESDWMEMSFGLGAGRRAGVSYGPFCLLGQEEVAAESING